MKIRGWLIVGGAAEGMNLPISAKVNWDYPGSFPPLAHLSVGSWFYWQIAPFSQPITVVLVEVPLIMEGH